LNVCVEATLKLPSVSCQAPAANDAVIVPVESWPV
jgi:hypothetical protein